MRNQKRMMHLSNSKSAIRASKRATDTNNLNICPGTECQNQDTLDDHNNSTFKTTSKFEGFPLDIVNIILDILHEDHDKATIICLGLTCRNHWTYIQGKPCTYYRFHRAEDQLALGKYLTPLIETWMGPDYRRLGPLSRYIQTPFLSRAVYGSFPGAEEKALDDRWKDYKTLVIHEGNQEMHFVPRPLGQSADEWYPLAARELKKHILRGKARNDKDELYSAYRASSLYRWLMFNGGDKWLLFNRDHISCGKSAQFSLNPLIAMLIAFPDDGQSWPTKSKKSMRRSD